MTTTSASRTLAWARQFAKLWGFALFCVLVVYIFREVALPFLFAILVAYILAPLVARLAAAHRRGGLPRWVAVIILYVFILSGLGFFIGYFVPKLSGDFARLFREAPALFAKVNKDWLPGPARGSTRTSRPRRSTPTTTSRRGSRSRRRRARSSSSRWRRGATASTSTRSTSRCGRSRAASS